MNLIFLIYDNHLLVSRYKKNDFQFCIVIEPFI